MKKILRVWHIPQVPNKPFYVPVENEREAALVMHALAIQHLWLEKENIIDDYSNAMGVEVFEDGEWSDYYDEDGNDFDDYADEHFPTLLQDIREANKM